jgi:hypothetical protein
VAVARALAIVMRVTWRDGTNFVGDPSAEEDRIDAFDRTKVQRFSRAR